MRWISPPIKKWRAGLVGLLGYPVAFRTKITYFGYFDHALELKIGRAQKEWSSHQFFFNYPWDVKALYSFTRCHS